jgi:hypothetical protein
MSQKMLTAFSVLVVGIAMLLISATAAETEDNPFFGNWALTLPGGGPGWLNVRQENGYIDADLLWYGGSVLPVLNVCMVEEEALLVEQVDAEVPRVKNEQGKTIRSQTLVRKILLKVSGDMLEGKFYTPQRNSKGYDEGELTGKRIPPPPAAPDLTNVEYGDPINIFNGENLDGWKLTNANQVNGWKVVDGILSNFPLRNRGEKHPLLPKLREDIKVARNWLKQAGNITFAEEKITWNAVNQFSQNSSQVTLPKMMVGDRWLGQNYDRKTPSVIVDEVEKLVGETCTIFQRMNSDGDMLRVCTNVETSDGSRAISTYIPAVNPDGKANPVISTVLKGEPYFGPAFVVNTMYLAAYDPIFDTAGNVIGMIYVGFPQEKNSYGNLRTEQEFEDFNLKLEVKCPKGSNSGVYLRGLYEVQVADSYGQALDSHNMGAIYSRIPPTSAAEKPAGEWQSLDMTLCERHITVILNGVKIIDNQPVMGCTGGALTSDEFKPGPLYLQGDHGEVHYRHIVLTPIIK